MRILIIDDDRGFCQMTENILVRHGYTVDVFHNAKEGIKHARENKPNLILMDIMLPGLSGPEAINYLKEESQFEDIPVVFLTALVAGEERDLEDAGVMVGNSRYQALGKPYKIERLLATIRKYAK